MTSDNLIPNKHFQFVQLLKGIASLLVVLMHATGNLKVIAGDAALFFDPESPEDIAEKIVYFYDHLI